MYDFLLNAKDACDLVAHFKQSQIEAEEEYEKRVQQTVEKNLEKINNSRLEKSVEDRLVELGNLALEVINFYNIFYKL